MKGRPLALAIGLLLGALLRLAAEEPLHLALDEPLAHAEAVVLANDLTIAGSTVPLATVTLTRDGILAQTVTADSAGHFAFDPLPLRDGANPLRISTRRGDEVIDLDRRVRALRRLPRLSVSAPGPELPTTAAEQVTVSGTSEPGIAILVAAAGEVATVRAAEDGSFSLGSPGVLQPGANQIVVTATDSLGTSSSVERLVLVDREPPLLQVLAPFDVDGWVNRRSADLQVRTEPGATASLQVADGPLLQSVAGADGLVTFAGTVLRDGPNQVVLTASDPVGNVTRASRLLRCDVEPPPLVLAAPLHRPAVRTSATSWLLQGRSVYGQTIHLTHNDRAVADLAADAEGRFSSPELALVDGDNLLRLWTTDEAGNSTQVHRVVCCDREPPTLQLTAPGPVEYVETATVLLAGRTEPRAAVVLGGPFNLVTQSDAGGRFRFAEVPVADGLNSFLLTLTDDLGNAAVWPLEVWGRVSPPTLQVLAPQDGWQAASPRGVRLLLEEGLRLTATLDGRALRDWELTAADPVGLPRQTALAALPDLAPGEHLLQVAGVSSAGGRRAEVTRRFHVPGPPRTLRYQFEPAASGGGQLTAELLDAWSQPVADGTTLTLLIPSGWETALAQTGEVRLPTRVGRVVAPLTPRRGARAARLQLVGLGVIESVRLDPPTRR
ncbi:MAG: hypothetical protein IT204_24390 [Fimbriimonadaceae bacterium]|nr:hypothetical protein [Fimbriimonadaceae bacterium]